VRTGARSLPQGPDRTSPIWATLQGPKIRVGKFKDGKVTLNTATPSCSIADCEIGDQGRVGPDYKELPRECIPATCCFLTTARSCSKSKRSGQRGALPRRHGGVLSNNKGINRLGGGLPLLRYLLGHG